MEAVVTTGAVRRANLQSDRHQHQTNTQFFTDRFPFCCPTNSVKVLTGKYHIPRTGSPQAHLGTSSFVSDCSRLYWERVAMPLVSPCTPVPLS